MTIDVIRGLAVASMIVSHSSLHSVLFRVTHFVHWIDGAEGFVLLAGLVLGMVHRRSRSFGSSARRIGKRAAVVYAAHVLIVLLAFLTLLPPTLPPPPSALGGWGPAVLDTLTLQVNPDQFAFLSMYVILFGETLIAIFLLRRRMAWWVAAVSIAIYIVASMRPDAFSLPEYPDGGRSGFNIGTWQLLWMSGLIFGWIWKEYDLQRVLRNRWLVLVGLASLGIAAILAPVVDHLPVAADWWPTFSGIVTRMFDKESLGPASVYLSWCAVVVLYATLWRARNGRIGAAMSFLFAGIGRRSLDSLILLSVMLELVPLFVPFQPESATGMTVACVIFLTCWVWARYRREATLGELLRRLVPRRRPRAADDAALTA